jgi:DNA-directed RNA polymerase specialized sigma24 family protein
MAPDLEESFDTFVRARGEHFLRVAALLTGSPTEAEDLLQASLVRLYRAWPRLGVPESAPDAYLRKILVNTRRSWWRAKWRRESPVANVPDRPDPASGADPADGYALGALVRSGAVAALGGAAALGVTLTATVADAPSALAAVTAAAAKTSAQSFAVTQVFSSASEDGKQLSWLSTGVFDPRHRLGKEIVGGVQIRFVGGTMYSEVGASSPLSHGKPWVESPTPPLQSTGTAAATGWITQGFSLNQPVDPSALLGLLKSAASVQAEGAASGPGWTGTKYAITAEPPKGATIGGTTTGTVYVDNQGRVRRLVTTLTWQLPGSSTRQHLTTDVTLGGFGVRVSVAPPPASQVYNLGKLYIVVSPSGVVEPLPKFSP